MTARVIPARVGSGNSAWWNSPIRALCAAPGGTRFQVARNRPAAISMMTPVTTDEGVLPGLDE
jgi:hypothetical protein